MATAITRFVSSRFFLIRFFKRINYDIPVSSHRNLVRKIVATAECVRNTPDLLEKVHESMQVNIMGVSRRPAKSLSISCRRVGRKSLTCVEIQNKLDDVEWFLFIFFALHRICNLF